MEPAEATIRLPSALEPPRPTDRLRYKPFRGGLAGNLPEPSDVDAVALVPLADRDRLALLGLAACQSRVAGTQHSQRPPRAEPRSCSASLGTALVQPERSCDFPPSLFEGFQCGALLRLNLNEGFQLNRHEAREVIA